MNSGNGCADSDAIFENEGLSITSEFRRSESERTRKQALFNHKVCKRMYGVCVIIYVYMEMMAHSRPRVSIRSSPCVHNNRNVRKIPTVGR